MQATIRHRRLRTGIALLLGLGMAGQAGAFDDDLLKGEVQIEYRQGVMEALGGNASAISAVVIDGADEYRGNLETHARFIRDMTEDIPALFPEGSDFGDTDALPEIWEEPEKFEERADDTHEKAVALFQAVEEENEEEIGPRFRELGESCSACHDDFREGD